MIARALARAVTPAVRRAADLIRIGTLVAVTISNAQHTYGGWWRKGGRSTRATHDWLRQGLNVVLSIAQLVAISAAVATDNGAVLQSRDAAEPPVIPAGYAFSIWSYIYPAAIAYAVYQALPRQRDNALLRRIGWRTASTPSSGTTPTSFS